MKVAVFQIFIIVAPALSLQHKHCSDELHGCGTGHSPVYYRENDSKDSSETKPTSSSIELSNDRNMLRSAAHKSKSLRKRRKYDCICDCRQKCEKLSKCCRRVCSNECDTTEENSVESDPGVGSDSLVFVPYPYPLVVPPLPIPLPPTTLAPTRKHCSSLSRCSIRRQSDLEDDSVLDLLESLIRKQEPPHVNLRPVNRRPIQYEEIDNHLLDRLIRQRNVKDINS